MNLLGALGPRGDVLVTLDFESYYDAEYSLRVTTNESYVRDARFEVLGVGVKWGREPAVWMEDADFRAWAGRLDWSRIACLAHHAQFDGFVLSHHYSHRPRFWLDTLSIARAIHGPSRGASLEALAEFYGVGQKGHELADVKGKRRRDLSAEEWLTFGGYCRNDCELTRALLDRMLPGFPREELWLIDSTVRMFTEPVLVADQGVLSKALAEERTKKREVLEKVAGIRAGSEEDALEAARASLASNDKFADLLRRFGVEPPTKQGKKGTIYAFAKSDPGMQALLEHQDDEIRALAHARLTVKSTIVETRTERLAGIGRRGAVPIYLKYAGAHTIRWSGGDKMNPQNFNRGGALRDALVAPPGWMLVVADSSQIEARVVAWLAGETRLLETFRRNDAQNARYQAAFVERVAELGREPTKDEAKIINQELAAAGIQEGDFYSDVGSQFFGRQLSKKDTPVERQTSKSMVLGLGFGMGWQKFAAELLKGMLGAPPVQFGQREATQYRVDVAAFERKPFGRDGETCGDRVREMLETGVRLGYADLLVHCAVTAYFVGLYRSSYSRISGLWYAMGDLLETMEDPEGDPVHVRQRFGCLEVMRHALRKPNGMTLHYPGLRRRGNDFTYMGGASGREVTKVYGGLLTENVVQSLARDVVAEQLLWVRANGYRVVTCTHDEIVACVPENRAEGALAKTVEIMRRPPEWCRDLPLNASGAVARRYGEAK